MTFEHARVFHHDDSAHDSRSPPTRVTMGARWCPPKSLLFMVTGELAAHGLLT